ncbi:MarR family winged helix-turn-helix transcriptional regulator [Nonomuraea sp. NPDC050227]|uniref:MarR family winged helix-turn-helix transcriptional regulator n=1 Tax=Nonomuraea sp. NPDC050227 TaxID=3364360 RepID=UPI0037BC42D5
MTEPRWLNTTEMRAWSGFLETASLLQRLIDVQLRTSGGVTQVQYEILHRLNESSGKRLCMSALAEQMVSSRSGLTYQVSQLEKRGLVQRTADPADERGVLAVLTDEGGKVLAESAPGHVRTVREGLLEALTADQVARLADVMDITRAHLRDMVPTKPVRKRTTE